MSIKPDRETVVFTGSSSIRFWENLQEMFPDKNIVNSGFGGSMASDLLVYLDDLVLDYEPNKVFIYEGDNDIEKPKGINRVYRQISRIVKRIHKHDKDIEIVLIGVKPSPERWQLRDKYVVLNSKLQALSANTANLDFAPIWDSFLDEGQLRNDIYLDDGLHLNERGYAILNALIQPFL